MNAGDLETDFWFWMEKKKKNIFHAFMISALVNVVYKGN